ncbi:MAG: hypothetical protein HQK96_19255 [Nitrospirae bacterium]|nr:hypothetical protein [Nitrospirota bacterium]
MEDKSHKDVADYVVKLKHTKDDFLKLMQEAKEVEVTEADLERLQEGKSEKSKSLSAVDILLPIAREFDIFHDQKGDPYVFFEGKVMPLDDKVFIDFLMISYHDATGKLVSRGEVVNITSLLCAEARRNGKEKRLDLRISMRGEGIFYDLCNGNMVEISENGWQVVKVTPLFYSNANQKAQVTPTKDGDINKIFRYVNITEDARLLFLVYMVTCFVPDIPKPILHPTGSEGTGKTTCARLIKGLVDPCDSEFCDFSKNLHDSIIGMLHDYYVVIDNLSFIDAETSDVLAKLCTGLAFKTRALYTNTVLTVIKLMKAMCLTGISCVATRPDLMDRTLLIPLERIDGSKRMTEKQIFTAFEKDKSEILGGIFDALSKAIGIYPLMEKTITNLPRMADFTLWGASVAEALGFKYQDFIEAYGRNTQNKSEELVHGNTLLQAVLEFMDKRDTHETLTKTFFEELKANNSPDKNDKTFPLAPNKLKNALERIKGILASSGIFLEFPRRTEMGNNIVIRKKKQDETIEFLD